MPIKQGLMSRTELFRCRDCGKYFSAATGGDCIDLTQHSKIPSLTTPVSQKKCPNPECGSTNTEPVLKY